MNKPNLNLQPSLIVIVLILALSCKNNGSEQEAIQQADQDAWVELTLDDLSDFQGTTDNWVLAGGVTCDTSVRRHLVTSIGTGVLANQNTEGEKRNIFTSFDHADIELKLEVLVPRGSNSGIYLQSRYEVQLLDSWGVAEPRHSDIGGIYQRWDETRPDGEKGFDGVPPITNAALPPGQWQSFHIIFRAPEFDAAGNKTKNAFFELVTLNNKVVQKEVEATGPTRASDANDEVAKAALMFQGDHGPIAFRSIKYRHL